MSVRVLYVVGKLSPSSIPLEVAQHIKDERVRLHVVEYYESEYDIKCPRMAISHIGAQWRGDLRGVWKLLRCTFSYQPDVVHVHHTVSAFWATLFGRMIGAKVIRTEHSNTQFHTLGQRIPNTVSRALADLLICNSKNTYRSLSALQKRIVQDRWQIVYNGIDVDRIHRAASGVPPFDGEEKTVTIGSVGRLVDQKNYRRLIEAFAQVRAESSQETRLVIVGDGGKRTDLEQRADKLGVRDFVTFTGEIGRDKVYAALHSFDVFVMPSLSEGFCNAAVEAMAAGLPLACSDIPTLQEVAGEAPVYADPNDPSDLSAVLLQLLEEGKEGWRERGREARDWATKRYSVQRTAREYARAYHQVVAKSRKVGSK